ncbi:MAG: hemerythrin domain-containing protein [Chloroflexi bacterium]|nr:hemerythrin domain-containing protein [Chloroflexota bacterium]
MSGKVSEVRNFKQEHEAIRVYMRQVEKSIAGVDALLASAPEEQLKPFREKLFGLYYALLHLEDGAQGHMEREKKTLFPRLDSDSARMLQGKHEGLVREVNRTVVIIREALPEKTSRNQLKESSVLVQKAYNRAIGMILKHMATEDALIDTLEDPPGRQ